MPERDWLDDDIGCDCADEEIDIVEGTAKCWRCGNSRVLSSDEFKVRMEQEAEYQIAYAEEMSRVASP